MLTLACSLSVPGQQLVGSRFTFLYCNGDDGYLDRSLMMTVHNQVFAHAT